MEELTLPLSTVSVSVSTNNSFFWSFNCTLYDRHGATLQLIQLVESNVTSSQCDTDDANYNKLVIICFPIPSLTICAWYSSSFEPHSWRCNQADCLWWSVPNYNNILGQSASCCRAEAISLWLAVSKGAIRLTCFRNDWTIWNKIDSLFVYRTVCSEQNISYFYIMIKQWQ